MIPPSSSGPPDSDEEDRLVRHAPLVYAVLRRVPHPPAIRDDLLQEGFMGLMEALRGYDPVRGVTFATYAVPRIWGRMRHFVRDGARRLGRETLSAPDWEPDPDDPFERLHTRLDLEHALSRLTPDEAHLIRRRFEAGLDERPLAAELGLSQPTVSRRLKKALLHLHQQLTADHAQPKRHLDRH